MSFLAISRRRIISAPANRRLRLADRKSQFADGYERPETPGQILNFYHGILTFMIAQVLRPHPFHILQVITFNFSTPSGAINHASKTFHEVTSSVFKTLASEASTAERVQRGPCLNPFALVKSDNGRTTESVRDPAVQV